RTRTDDAHLDAILGVPAGEAVEAVQAVAGVEGIAGAFAVDDERAGLEWDVHRAPPDVGFRLPGLDDAPVLGRAAGLDPGVGDQGAVVGDAGVLLVADGVLVKLTRRQVAVNLRDRDVIVLKIEAHEPCPFLPWLRLSALFLPSPPLRGRGVGGEGEEMDCIARAHTQRSETHHPPTPRPRVQGRGEKDKPDVSNWTLYQGLSPNS